MQPAILKIDVAALLLEKSPEQIFNLVDGGSRSETGLLWVFDLANNPAVQRRCLRFWRPELVARAAGQPSQYHQQGIGWVISQILPVNRKRLFAGEVDDLLQIRPRTRLDFGAQLPSRREDSRNTYARTTLEAFLCERWIGRAIQAAVASRAELGTGVAK